MSPTIDPYVWELAPEGAREPLRRLLAGQISPPIALLHLAPEFETAGDLVAFLRNAAREAPPALRSLAEFAEQHAAGLEVVRRMGMEHAKALEETGAEAVGRLYDRLAAIDPNTAVALYSFGDSALLDTVSAEILGYFERRELLGARTRLLEIGCGIGRLLERFATSCATVTGIDVSRTMVELSTVRLARHPNAGAQLGNGADLAGFSSGAFDVVVAADSWPHVVALGSAAVDGLAAEVRRVLAPGGTFVVLNFSYREAPEADARDVRRLADRLGFEVLEAGTRPFEVWDGVAWRLRLGAG